MNELTFNVGDKAVYPAHGVAEVVGVETRTIADSETVFYILRIVDSGTKLMVPTTNINAVGLRELITSDEVDEIFAILESQELSVDSQTWNRRYREYMEKIKTGSLYEIAEVLRDLLTLRRDKDLSFGERKLLETCRNLVVQEVALACGQSEEAIRARLDSVFEAESAGNQKAAATG